MVVSVDIFFGIFTPKKYLGEMGSNFDVHIFKVGWFNHQLDCDEFLEGILTLEFFESFF